MADGSMKNSRRRFLLQGMAGALALCGIGSLDEAMAAAASVDLNNFRLPRVRLGNTGLRPTLLAMGTGTSGGNYQSDQTRLGFDNLVSFMEYAYDRGVKLFDCAQQYGSHPHLGKALTSGGGTIPRDDVVILTKINMDYNYTGAPYRPDQQIKDPVVYAREVLNTLLTQTGTDHFDVVLLHHVGAYSLTGDWISKVSDVMEALSEEKAAGKIRALGVSQHSPTYGDLQPITLARDSDWVEVDFVRINPWGGVAYGTNNKVMDAPTDSIEPILRTMRERGKGLIGMKVLNLGRPVDNGGFDAEQRQAALAYATSGLIDCFTVGMVSREQLDENLTLIAMLLQGRKNDEMLIF